MTDVSAVQAAVREGRRVPAMTDVLAVEAAVREGRRVPAMTDVLAVTAAHPTRHGAGRYARITP